MACCPFGQSSVHLCLIGRLQCGGENGLHDGDAACYQGWAWTYRSPGRIVMVVASRLVVVVEDDDSMRQASERLLHAGGFESRAFASAEAFLAAPVEGSAACVVSDFKLPGMSGLELLGELRARARKEPFILITAHDAPGLRDEAARRGVAAYLAKPFRGTLFLDAIKVAAGPQATP